MALNIENSVENHLGTFREEGPKKVAQACRYNFQQRSPWMQSAGNWLRAFYMCWFCTFPTHDITRSPAVWSRAGSALEVRAEGPLLGCKWGWWYCCELEVAEECNSEFTNSPQPCRTAPLILLLIIRSGWGRWGCGWGLIWKNCMRRKNCMRSWLYHASRSSMEGQNISTAAWETCQGSTSSLQPCNYTCTALQSEMLSHLGEHLQLVIQGRVKLPD